MSRKLPWLSLLMITSVIGVNAGGQFAILHAPRSVAVTVGGEVIHDDALMDIYSVALGFTTGIMVISSRTEMKISNPFDTPEAAVAMCVEGVSSIGGFDGDSKIYSLNLGIKDVSYDMIEKIFFKFEPKGKLVNIRLSSEYDLRTYSDIFGEYTNYKLPKLQLAHLMYTVEQDYRFLRELQALTAITVSVKSGILKPDGAKDFYMFKFTSLGALTEHYGHDSDHTIEAKNLLNKRIRQLNSAFKTAYDGNVLFTVVITNITMQRKKRHSNYVNNSIKSRWRRSDIDENENENKTKEEENVDTQKEKEVDTDETKQLPNKEAEEMTKDDEEEKENVEITKDIQEADMNDTERLPNNEEYENDTLTKDKNETATDETKRLTPGKKGGEKKVSVNDIAMINIIFWTCIALFYAMLASCYSIITLDPGRDSIVYRMTSQIDRIKMD